MQVCGVCICLCVHVFVHGCVHVDHVCVCYGVHVCACMYVRVVCACVCVHVCVHVCVSLCLCVCECAYVGGTCGYVHVCVWRAYGRVLVHGHM